MKKLVYGSMVAAALVFSGCGSSSTSTPPAPTVDTTGPVFTTGTAITTVTGGTVTLAATDVSAPVTFTLGGTDANVFTLSGATLTAPDTNGTYSIDVTATDSATTPNATTQTIAVTVNLPAAGSGITYGGLEWDALIKYDDNETLSGRKTQTEAGNICTADGKRLPTLAELTTNASSLKTDTAFRSDAGNQLVVWASEATKGYYFNGTDANVSNDDDNYTEANASTTNFYTCVK